MKHIRNDHTFVYYYSVDRATGETCGVRFSRGTVASFRGHDANPEAIPVTEILNLPIHPDDDMGAHLYDAVAEVIDTHPEVADLLAGRVTIADA